MHVTRKALRVLDWFCKSKLGLSNFLIFVVATPLTYAALLVMVKMDFFTAIEMLPREIKALFSINTWWVEILISLSIPLLLLLAFSIQLARMNPEDADLVKKIIPWLPKIRNLIYNPVTGFFVFTAAVLTGVILLLSFGAKDSDISVLFMLAFPALILYLAFWIRELLSTQPSSGKFARFILSNPQLCTGILICLAAIAWIYSNIYRPIDFRLQLLGALKALTLG
uniref:hypothetical protein n=1 Tax=Rheinheimera sp. TaxID=1869214 RepID=UPI004047224D